MDRKKLEALAKKNMAKEQDEKDPKWDRRRQYDNTLLPETPVDGESKKIFNEMKGKRKNQT